MSVLFSVILSYNDLIRHQTYNSCICFIKDFENLCEKRLHRSSYDLPYQYKDENLSKSLLRSLETASFRNWINRHPNRQVFVSRCTISNFFAIMKNPKDLSKYVNKKNWKVVELCNTKGGTNRDIAIFRPPSSRTNRNVSNSYWTYHINNKIKAQQVQFVSLWPFQRYICNAFMNPNNIWPSTYRRGTFAKQRWCPVPYTGHQVLPGGRAGFANGRRTFPPSLGHYFHRCRFSDKRSKAHFSKLPHLVMHFCKAPNRRKAITLDKINSISFDTENVGMPLNSRHNR